MTEEELKKLMLAIAAGLDSIETRLTQIEENTRQMRKVVTTMRYATPSPTSVHDPRNYR